MTACDAENHLNKFKLDKIIKPQPLIKSYHNNCINFRDNVDRINDKALIISVMIKVNESLSLYDHHLGIVKVILLKRGTYGDRPFTTDSHTIAITEKFLDLPKNLMTKILIHEAIHLDQKTDIYKYESYYKKLGFERIGDKYKYLNGFRDILMGNPDANEYKWIYMKRYIPFAIENKNKTFLYDKETSQVICATMVSSYYNAFGTKNQLYHPNEIVAHIICDYVADGTKYDVINYRELRTLIKN